MCQRGAVLTSPAVATTFTHELTAFSTTSCRTVHCHAILQKGTLGAPERCSTVRARPNSPQQDAIDETWMAFGKRVETKAGAIGMALRQTV